MGNRRASVRTVALIWLFFRIFASGRWWWQQRSGDDLNNNNNNKTNEEEEEERLDEWKELERKKTYAHLSGRTASRFSVHGHGMWADFFWKRRRRRRRRRREKAQYSLRYFFWRASSKVKKRESLEATHLSRERGEKKENRVKNKFSVAEKRSSPLQVCPFVSSTTTTVLCHTHLEIPPNWPIFCCSVCAVCWVAVEIAFHLIK